MPTIGYLHTGIEKTAEQKKWQQVIPLVERMDYLSSHSNSLGYVLAVEKLLGLEMPDRVTWIRVLLVELQRLNSHLVWLGTHVMDLGAITVMLYTFNERELHPERERAHRRVPDVPELHPRRRPARGPAGRASTRPCATSSTACRARSTSARTC